ncbi:sugar hydrolase [Filimonas zeae]|uniref:Sugar hydrolase n=1 Tax=Filimonas zeae TaxID=1737353 RepID=A0A917MYZ2_9BACT|nr:GH92 family glycosyl hydrolase [Filimonas zeae]GGH80940.1 sugar hydrolase [Filimonas zeae]
MRIQYWYSFLGMAFAIPAMAQQTESLVPYVKPLTGTARMGHTYPGATVPFGMVQLSPDTDTLSYEQNGQYNKDVYRYCAGYQYADKTIVGFSHTHFNGTGHSDLGDFLIMPTTGALQLNPGTADKPESGYRSAFSHDNETAEAGYYKVKLDDHHITAELTTTPRVGIHRYTFPAADQAHIILDLVHGIYNYPDKNVWTYVRVVNDTLITGYRQTNGWARTRTEYFALSFSKPFKNYGCENSSARQVYRGFWRKFNQNANFPELAGKQLKLFFDFAITQGEQVMLKMALSPVSMDGALRNLRAEAGNWNFDGYKNAAQQAWENELHRVEIFTPDKATKEVFYTSLYHTFINPTVYMDVDGSYKGLDQNVHKADGFVNYTTFSLWDTYRALHPFFNLIQPARNADMIRSMLAHYDQTSLHMLPIWSHYANENWCMTGYHSVSLIADAVVKGNASFDANKALDACIVTASNRWYEGVGDYTDKGYVPEDKSGASVSKTLEYAYDDWAIAQMARKLNRPAVYDSFMRRAAYYKNVFDASTGFMRPRLSNGSFKKEFDPLDTEGQGFIEGNAWNYSLYVPQDPGSMIELMGGKKRFVAHLDSLFTMHLPDKYFEHTEDITRDGIIGNYVHGNEPSHHVAYLYNWAGAPAKTQERVRMILKHQYHTGADGLGGNDDCGQMSAWYIFSTLGFYPVAPGSEDYAIGSPAIEKAVLHLENGNTFTVEAQNQSDKNVYVKKMLLNGQPYTKTAISHADIVKGGSLVFVMSNKP